MKYVYEVITTNKESGQKDSAHFSNRRAAETFAESARRDYGLSADICLWKVYNKSDI